MECKLVIRLIFLSLFFSSLSAAEITVQGNLFLTDKKGNIKKDASHCYVYIFGKGYTEKASGIGGELVQKDRQFALRTLAIVMGQKVEFINQDPIYHNVFSPAKLEPKLDLGLFKKGEDSRSYTFYKPGNYQIYCNIHPEMVSNILVLPNKAFARVAVDGSFKITNIKKGQWHLGVWSPLAKKSVKIAIDLTEKKILSVNLELQEALPNIPKHSKKDGERYKKY